MLGGTNKKIKIKPFFVSGLENVTHVTIYSQVPRISKRRLPPPPNPFVAKKRYVSYVL